MNNSFLIARNKKDNTFEVVGINEKWYLGTDGRDYTHYACDLEAIDLVTSQFKNREQFASRLFARGFIKNSDVDLFVATKNTVDGKDYVKIDEIIYNPNNSRRMQEFRKIADSSLSDCMDDVKVELGEVFEDIIMTIYSADDLRALVSDGYTSLSKGLVELLSNVHVYSDVPLKLKYEREFRRANYHTIRNIVETLNRFDLISKCSRDDRYLANEVFIEENKADRMALVPKLSFGLSGDYGAEQMVLADCFKDDEKVRKAAKEVAREERVRTFIPEKPTISRIVVDDRKSVADKKQEIFRVLRKLPTNTFNSSSSKYKVNYDLFDVEVYDDEKSQLDTLLTGNLPKYFMNYARHRAQYAEVYKYNPVSSELGEIRSSMESDLASIRKRFRSAKCINDTYNWCMLWEGCMKRSSEYDGASGKGNCGKTYGKH